MCELYRFTDLVKRALNVNKSQTGKSAAANHSVVETSPLTDKSSASQLWLLCLLCLLPSVEMRVSMFQRKRLRNFEVYRGKRHFLLLKTLSFQRIAALVHSLICSIRSSADSMFQSDLAGKNKLSKSICLKVKVVQCTHSSDPSKK